MNNTGQERWLSKEEPLLVLQIIVLSCQYLEGGSQLAITPS